jgi:hypothetical protein
MPTTSAKAARLLKAGAATVMCAKPFSIQLLQATGETVQSHVLGQDAGYANVGISVVNEVTGSEVYSAEITLLTGMSERITERSRYRRIRRSNKTRYRAPRFNNRTKPGGWLAPSIQHKLDSHKSIIAKAASLIPITRSVIETAQFDIQKIRNPEISGSEYQQGEQEGFWNLREYVLHRDGHKCQNPDCTSKGKVIILQVHHLGFWKNDRTDRPENLITLCTVCHKPQNHSKKGFLFGWQPKLKGFKPETFMSSIYWRLLEETNKLMPTTRTYGYITKSKRIAQSLEKSHATDAFMIAGGSDGARAETLLITQSRRNNRALSNWRDAKYTDIRTGEAASASELNCGRRTRNKNLNTGCLRKFRGTKLSIGCVRIRKQRFSLQPKDIVVHNNRKYQVAGMQNKGAYVKLRNLSKPVKISSVTPYRFITGLVAA